MKKLTLLLTFLVCGGIGCLFAGTLEAQTTTSANQDAVLIEKLYNSGRFIEAYELGLALEDKHSGNPKFDFYFGMSAVRSGDASKGVYALERVQYSEPQSPRLAFEIGKAYYDLEQYPRAKKLFEQVLNSNPPQDVAQTSRHYLEAIQRNEHSYMGKFYGQLELNLGSDSNVNTATSDSVIKGLTPRAELLFNSFGLSREIASTSRALDSAYHNAGLRVRYNKPFSPKLSFNLGASANLINYNDKKVRAFKQHTLGVFAGLGHKINANNQLFYSVDFQRLNLDNKDLRDAPSFTATLQNRFDSSSQLQSYLRYSAYNNIPKDSSDLDTTALALGSTYFKQLGTRRMQPLFYIGLTAINEKPKKSTATLNASLKKLIIGLQTGVALNLNASNSLGIDLSYLSANYDGKQLLFDKKRSDNSASISLNYQYYIAKAWQIGAEIRHSNNDSNINIYKYQRTKYQIGAKYNF